MSVSNEKVIDRWSHRVLTGEYAESPSGRVLSTDGRNLMAMGDTLYSYGTHFVLAIAARDKHGEVTHFVLNGDRYSVTTSQHQTMTRRLCADLARRLGGVPVVILPFSALAAAGVTPTELDVIDVRADRNETEYRSSSGKPGTNHVMMDCPEGRTTITSMQAYGIVNRETGSLYVETSSGSPERTWAEWPRDATVPEDRVLHDERPYPEQPSILDDRDGWRAWSERYTTLSRQVPRRVPLQVPNPERVYVGRSNWNQAKLGEDGIWRWEVQHHFLGDSLFRAPLTENVNVKPTPEQVAAFDRHHHAANMAMSLREHLFDEKRAGRNWDGHEQGELFNITTRHHWNSGYAVPRSPEMIAELEREHERWDNEREEAGRALLFAIPTRNWTTRDDRLVILRRRTRTAYFLSSFDYQESIPLYFLCELPRRARPTTVDEAIDCLKPPEVVAAEARGLKVTRQGDLFAIPTQLARRQVRRMLGRTGFQKRLRVLGTNHSVTEGALCKGGAVLGRGVMRHEPDDWRGADHKRQRMGDGKTWHMLVRNTVPRQ